MCCLTNADQLRHYILQLLAKEYGNNRRRCLVCSQSVVVARICCGLTEQICMLIYRFQDTGQYQQELYVLVRCLARIQQVDAIVRGQRPVVVLTGTIYTCERFLMQQTFHTVLACYSL